MLFLRPWVYNYSDDPPAPSSPICLWQAGLDIIIQQFYSQSHLSLQSSHWADIYTIKLSIFEILTSSNTPTTTTMNIVFNQAGGRTKTILCLLSCIGEIVNRWPKPNNFCHNILLYKNIFKLKVFTWTDKYPGVTQWFRRDRTETCLHFLLRDTSWKQSERYIVNYTRLELEQGAEVTC